MNLKLQVSGVFIAARQRRSSYGAALNSQINPELFTTTQRTLIFLRTTRAATTFKLEASRQHLELSCSRGDRTKVGQSVELNIIDLATINTANVVMVLRDHVIPSWLTRILNHLDQLLVSQYIEVAVYGRQANTRHFAPHTVKHLVRSRMVQLRP
jgi:hypothetical protein